MFHSKSKSTKIQEKEKEKNIANLIIKKTNKYNDNNSINFTNIDSTKENLDLNLIKNEYENIEKISNLLCEDHDDKIVNISKLDESLFPDEKNNKNGELLEKNKNISNFDIIGDDNEKDNSNPIINISNLEMPIFKNELQNINKSIEDNNTNDNINKNENNKNIIKIIKNKNEVIKMKKKKNCFQKIPLFCKIILIINIFIIISFLFFFLFKIVINKY